MKDAYICLVIFIGACIYMGNSLRQEITDVLHEWAHTMEQENHNHLHSFSIDADQNLITEAKSEMHNHVGIQLFQAIFKTQSDNTAQPVLPVKSTKVALQSLYYQEGLEKITFPSKSLKPVSYVKDWSHQFSTYPEPPPPQLS